MSPEEEAFTDALVRAIVADIAAHPANGALVRVVLRWFEPASPEYFTLHAFGEDDEDAGEDAWLPLEWANLDAELERTDRVSNDPEVTAAAEALAPLYEELEAEGPSPAIREAVRRLPDALAGAPRAPHFAVLASHFEAYGMLTSLQASNPPAVVAALEARGELPWDDD